MAELRIKVKYNFGTTVYSKVDLEQMPGIVTQLYVAPGGRVRYEVCFGDHMVSSFYDFQLSTDRDRDLVTKSSLGLN